MRDHLAILEDLARSKATCRVIMRAEREALETAIARCSEPRFEPEAVRELCDVAEQSMVGDIGGWVDTSELRAAAKRVRESEVKP